MHQIPPHLLWLGHAGDGRDLRAIFEQGIQARVELAAEEPLAPASHDLITCRFPLVDGNGNDPAMLRMALRTVAHLLRDKVPTLVCCGAGLSRSPAIAAGAIALITDDRPEDCLVRVLSHRPADLVAGLWHEVANAVAPLQAEFAPKLGSQFVTTDEAIFVRVEYLTRGPTAAFFDDPPRARVGGRARHDNLIQTKPLGFG